MFTTLLTTLATTLATKGFDLLSDLIMGATDTGIDRAKTFIEEKTGISLAKKDGSLATLTPVQLEEVKKTILEYHIELERILLEKDKLSREDVTDARDLQESTIENYIKAPADVRKKLWLPINFIYIVSLLFICFIFVYLSGITFGGEIDKERLRFVDQIIIQLFNNLSLITGFFFGNMYNKVSSSMPPSIK